MIYKFWHWLVESSLPQAATAGAGVAATGLGGLAVLGPSWIVFATQGAVMIVFTVMAIDKRMAKLHSVVNEMRGEVEVLRGRMKALPCQGPAPVCSEKEEP